MLTCVVYLNTVQLRVDDDVCDGRSSSLSYPISGDYLSSEAVGRAHSFEYDLADCHIIWLLIFR